MRIIAICAKLLNQPRDGIGHTVARGIIVQARVTSCDDHMTMCVCVCEMVTGSHKVCNI